MLLFANYLLYVITEAYCTYAYTGDEGEITGGTEPSQTCIYSIQTSPGTRIHITVIIIIITTIDMCTVQMLKSANTV